MGLRCTANLIVCPRYWCASAIAVLPYPKAKAKSRARPKPGPSLVFLASPSSQAHSPMRPKKSVTPDNFHDCSLLDRTTLARHDTLCTFMEEQYKGTLSESQQKRITAHIRGNQFAQYWMERRESLLNSSTGRLVTTRLIKPRR